MNFTISLINLNIQAIDWVNLIISRKLTMDKLEFNNYSCTFGRIMCVKKKENKPKL